MQKGLQTLDYIVFLIYFIIVSGYGYWVYQRKKKGETSSNDFFLAEGSLTWWAIGASLIASNISAEQLIGASGSGFNLGLAIATYEWMAAATLIIVALFFMPIYLKNRIFTMPQFLTQRYNMVVSTIMAVFWLMLYIIVNLTSILYLGALAINTISGIDFSVCMIGLAVFAVIITLGGMKVIGFTDVVQVFFLILGGLVTTYLAVNLVSTLFHTHGTVNGFNMMMTEASDHFHMIFKRGQMIKPDGGDAYMDLPGLTVLVGGMWIVNLNYWGCNQYITQRALGADLKTARSGILFAAFLKLLMPVIVVLPGIAAYVLYKNGFADANLGVDFVKDLIDKDVVENGKLIKGELNGDRAYPVLLNLLPKGLKGLSFAALTAAIVASLAGKANSISTIFTLDIYKKFINKEATEKQLVITGRIAILVAMVLAIGISPLLGIDKKGGFQFIQEYTGFVSPGIFAIFILGFFWKRTTSAAAVVAAIMTLPLSIILKFLPVWTNHSFPDIPFLDRMGWVFAICVALMVIFTLADPKSKRNPKGLEIDAAMFKPNTGFFIGAAIVLAIITALYTIFW